MKKTILITILALMSFMAFAQNDVKWKKPVGLYTKVFYPVYELVYGEEVIIDCRESPQCMAIRSKVIPDEDFVADSKLYFYVPTLRTQNDLYALYEEILNSQSGYDWLYHSYEWTFIIVGDDGTYMICLTDGHCVQNYPLVKVEPIPNTDGFRITYYGDSAYFASSNPLESYNICYWEEYIPETGIDPYD